MKKGIGESWNIGIVGQKDKGKMESWNIGMTGPKNKSTQPIIPSFHSSNIPMFFGFPHSGIPVF